MLWLLLVLQQTIGTLTPDFVLPAPALLPPLRTLDAPVPLPGGRLAPGAALAQQRPDRLGLAWPATVLVHTVVSRVLQVYTKLNLN